MLSNIKVSYKEIFFLCFFCIITFGKSIGLGADNKFLQLITIVAFVSLGIKFSITKYTFNEFMFSFSVVILGMATYFVTKREGILLTILTIVGLKDVEIGKVFKCTFFIRVIMYISTISLTLLGLIENKKILHWREGVGYVYRYGLGYDHPNLLHSTLFILVALFLYLYYKNLNIVHYSFIFILNLIIYKFSLSRTGFYLIILSLILTIFMKKDKTNLKYKLTSLVIPSCVLFTFVSGFFYGKLEIFNKIDRLLSGRIYYTSYFLKNYSLSLFGNNLYVDNNLIDNSYIILLANYGIIVFILYLAIYRKVIKNFIINRLDKELLVIIIFSIYGITEGFLPNIFMNISLVFTSTILFKERLNEKEKLWK